MKKKILLVLMMCICTFSLMHAQVGINTTTIDDSAVLDINGTVVSGGVTSYKGLLIPRMNTTQKNLIDSPAPGLLVYDITLNCISQNAGTALVPNWKCLAGDNIQSSFFYMPAIAIDASNVVANQTINLFAHYQAQFRGLAPYNTVFKASQGAPSEIPYFATANQLYYYITSYDKAVLQIISLDANGVLTYDIIKESNFASFMNVVFVIK